MLSKFVVKEELFSLWNFCFCLLSRKLLFNLFSIFRGLLFSKSCFIHIPS